MIHALHQIFAGLGVIVAIVGCVIVGVLLKEIRQMSK
jgi:hypothetical protein